MPKCVKCMKLFHPDWCVEETIRGDEVIICVFCKTDKNELTLTDKDDKLIQVVTKEEAASNYKKYLEDLSRKPNIAKILSQGTKAN